MRLYGCNFTLFPSNTIVSAPVWKSFLYVEMLFLAIDGQRMLCHSIYVLSGYRIKGEYSRDK